MSKKAIFLVVLAAMLAACGPSETAVATSQAETEAARPTSTATQTPTPEPTATATQTPLPTTAADVFSQSFTGIELLHEENFDSAALPEGWTAHASVEGSARRGSIDPSDNGELMITGPGKAVFNNILLELNQGFFGRLMFNPSADFHIGLESAPNGQIIQRYRPNSSAYLFDMEIPRGVSSQIWLEDNFGFIPSGDSMVEGEWYYIFMGVDSNKVMQARVWNDNKQFVYLHPANIHFATEGIAENFRFVINVRNSGVLYVDDLQFFQFESFAGQ